jgi:hypothetical protein
MVAALVLALGVQCDRNDLLTGLSGSATSTLPSSTATASVPASASGVAAPEADAPPKPMDRASVLAGIAAVQAILRRRVTAGRQTDEACDARTTADEPRVLAARRQMGDDRWTTRTRFSPRPPGSGWSSVETLVAACLGCTGPQDSEAVPRECAQAITALGELAASVRAEKK